MAKHTSNSSNLAQLRSAEAARAFQNRPQAGQQGAPQNRAERRQAARNAGRQPKETSFNSTAHAKAQAIVPVTPADVARGAASTAVKVGKGFASGKYFPLSQMVPQVLVMVVLLVLSALWFGMPSLQTGVLKPYASWVSKGLEWAVFADAMVISYRSFVPMALALAISVVTMATISSPISVYAMFAGFALALPWLMGPQVSGRAAVGSAAVSKPTRKHKPEQPSGQKTRAK